MKTKTIEIYTLEELCDLADDPESKVTHDAYERAYSWVLEGNLDFDWWDSIEEDLRVIGLKLVSFDIDRYHEINLKKETGCWWNVAKLTLENHGHETETYKLVHRYLKLAVDARRTWLEREREQLRLEIEAGERSPDDDWITREDFEETDDAKELLDEFIHDLGEEYLSLLRREYEYRTSEEAVFETAEANDYHFNEDGFPD